MGQHVHINKMFGSIASLRPRGKGQKLTWQGTWHENTMMLRMRMLKLAFVKNSKFVVPLVPVLLASLRQFALYFWPGTSNMALKMGGCTPQNCDSYGENTEKAWSTSGTVVILMEPTTNHALFSDYPVSKLLEELQDVKQHSPEPSLPRQAWSGIAGGFWAVNACHARKSCKIEHVLALPKSNQPKLI